jgi:hypothetical protein
MTREMTQMLRLQWLSSRWLLLPIALICIGLPQAVVRMSVNQARATDAVLVPGMLIDTLQQGSILFPYLAAVTGALVALAAWNWDHRMAHVYALSLPVSRGRYALLKLWAGAVTLLVPTLAIWIGAWIATSGVTIPDGLEAYPFAFGARFLLAGALAYATMFALAAGTIRTTLILTVGCTLLVVISEIAVPMVERHYLMDLTTPAQFVADALRRWPGPFQVFSGNWLLIDV